MPGPIKTTFRALRTLAKLGLLLLLLVSGLAELWVMASSRDCCHDKAPECVGGSVGLVLGCSKNLGKGRPNFYFTGRMQAAERLWKSGRVRGLIVSGDNRSRYYNEPRDMKNALIERGVPADRIVCDYGGLRTYDSVVRAREIFGADALTIVSQREHTARAVTIARQLGIKADGLNAPLAPTTYGSRLRQSLRERAARIAMLVDFLIDRKPQYLGDKEHLPF